VKGIFLFWLKIIFAKMKEFSVTILGNGSAMPTPYQNVSAQLVKYNGHRFLIDCGDGTQIQMLKYRVGFKKFNHIFISHLHGDHFFGLTGLLSTLHLLQRKEPMNIYGPPQLKKFIDISLETANTNLLFPLIFHDTLGGNRLLYDEGGLQVYTVPLKHGVPTTGFLFVEKEGKRKIDKAFVSEYNPTYGQIKEIKEGADFVAGDGNVIKNSEITIDGTPGRRYAFCSDTAYFEDIIPLIKGADLLYHEATFDESTKVEALANVHSTAKEAAAIAKAAGVKRLLLGHFSARINGNFSTLEREAKSVFENSTVSEQGKTYEV
jgi:ribonuclease Z